MIARGVEFYRVLDVHGAHVGNMGYQARRQMFSYLQVDFPYRGRGIALAAKLVLEGQIADRGVEVAYAQVFRDNRRALTTLLSLGWEIDDDASTDSYYLLRKRLAGAESPHMSEERAGGGATR
jgi:GNAT superfamily N-acetyltransferase